MIKQPIPIWLDCDPGNDDAFAILLSLFDPRFDLLGITTVHGNAPLHMTTHNTLGLLDLLQTYNKVKVYSGSEVPLKTPPVYALNVHGANGLGGIEFPEKTTNQVCHDLDYLEAMKQTIDAYSGNICLVCTGALTNIAKLVDKYPEIKSKLKYVSIMGGSFGFGNITSYAEFNFHSDPHAAKIVVDKLSSKIILSPLNFTHKVIATKNIRQSVYDFANEKRNSYVRSVFHSILISYAAVYAQMGLLDGPPIHDPLAVYSLLPFVTGNFDEYGYVCCKKKIEVMVDSEHAGQTVFKDDDDDDGDGAAVYIGEKLDNKKFWDSILLSLKSADLHIKESVKV
ncbi:URH1 Uridine nucleosidase [Candida maltosa Xu316]|uniref:Inosine/uridine-preferring nucleoside hydrolase domain-containing protein n=1 Tax=Candida maltosa (strain Xu316) TaxID=1245528 RepID=M3ILA8_CANMX|nr:hypothetical protein G210_2573 [Candida maltosa Xu316]